jgi:hypothetical protein
MSRGLGRVQRKLLELLADGEHHGSLHLARDVYSIPFNNDGWQIVSNSRSAAIRRALRALAKAGLVEDCGRGCYSERYWCLAGRKKDLEERDRDALRKALFDLAREQQAPRES